MSQLAFFRGAKVVDFYVQRYPGAVSWFSPGSYALRPPLELKDLSNCVCAGKFVWRCHHSPLLSCQTGRLDFWCVFTNNIIYSAIPHLFLMVVCVAIRWLGPHGGPRTRCKGSLPGESICEWSWSSECSISIRGLVIIPQHRLSWQRSKKGTPGKCYSHSRRRNPIYNSEKFEQKFHRLTWREQSFWLCTGS